MARTDDEREFRLRPPKPRVTRNEGAAWSNGFKLIMHYARSSRKTGNRAPGGKGHGQDEQTGRNYLMLEGIDAKVHYIPYIVEMEEARSRGELRINSFMHLRVQFDADAPRIQVHDAGDAERLLSRAN
jgi:hypothetical protein